MNINPIFLVTAKDGEIKFHNKVAFAKYVRSLGDGLIEVVARKRRKTRSIQQNAYVWGVVYPLISDHTGHSTDEIHEIMKSMFLKKRIGKYVVTGSTSNLTTVEFCEYTDKVIQWASEQEINIPPPYTVDME